MAEYPLGMSTAQVGENQAGGLLSTRPAGVLVAILGGIATGASLVIALAAVTDARPNWILLAFEVVAMMAGVVCVLAGLRVLREGPAITLFCVAGTIMTAALLGGVGSNWTVRGFSLWLGLFLRAGIGGMLVALAGAELLSRRPGVSMPLLLRSVLWVLPLVSMIGAAVLLRGAWPNLHPLAQMLLVLFGGALACVFAAGSAHYAIRAFIVGAEAATAGVLRGGVGDGRLG